MYSVAQEAAKAARPGETIYKGHHSYDLMRNLQLGILFSIAKTSKALQAGRVPPLTPDDFKQQASPISPLFLPSSIPAALPSQCSCTSLCHPQAARVF